MNELSEKNDNLVVKNTTCFNEHKLHKVACNKTKCHNWIKSTSSHNCCIILANSGPQSLEDIGALFNLTRMRICQIEKETNHKIAKNIL